MIHKRKPLEFCALGIMLVTLLVSSASSAADATDKGLEIETTEDVVFGVSHPTDGTLIQRVMDVHTPVGGTVKKRPALLIFHGNPLRAPYPGDRQHRYRDLTGYLVKRGYVCFVVSYPFFGLVEAKTAVRHVRANAEKYGIDPNKIAAFGHSLGSNLTMRLGVTDEDHGPPNGAEQEDPVNNWGVSARVAAAILSGGGNAPRPYEEFDEDDAPICFVHSPSDPLAPFEMALKRRVLFQNANIPYAFLRVEDIGHSVPSSAKEIAFGKSFGELIDAFLSHYLQEKPETSMATLVVKKKGNGTITFDPEHGMYPKGYVVSVSAEPPAGSHFVEWRGDVQSVSSTIEVTMNSSKNLSAIFEEDEPKN
jgi:pimeloyl-ACP methyl ester carboxylesterase